MPGLDPETWPFATVVVLFVCCILIIGVAGIRPSFLAARLAPVVVVTGHDHEAVAVALADYCSGAG